MKRLKSGTTGWVLLASFVVGWDIGVALRGGGETLSSSFRRALLHPKARWPVIVAWGITTAHLFGRLPRNLDPFYFVARKLTTTNDPL